MTVNNAGLHVAVWVEGLVPFTGGGGSNPPSDTQLPAETHEPSEPSPGTGVTVLPRFPQPRSAVQHSSEFRGRRGLGVVVEVAVDVRRDRDRGVAELTRDDLEPGACCECERRVRVSRSVEPDRHDTGTSLEALPARRKRVRLNKRSDGLGHEPALVNVRRTERQNHN